MSVSRRSAGLWSESELFALKKNQAEDTRLKEKIGCMFMDHGILKQTMARDKRSIQLFLRNVKRSTGHSEKAVPTVQCRTNVTYNHMSTISYEVPGKLIQRSEKSYDLRPRNSLIAEIDEVIKDDNFTKTAFLNITQGKGVNRRRAVTTGEINEKTTFDSSNDSNRRLNSDVTGLKSVLIQNTKSEKYEYDDSVFDGDNKESDPKETEGYENEEEDEDDKNLTFLNMRYNPWNIQHRNGGLYDALRLPDIKDCYRPACRPSCITCMSRKRKVPCFVIPGITHPSDFVIPKLKTPENFQPPKSKSKRKKRSCTDTKSVDKPEIIQKDVESVSTRIQITDDSGDDIVKELQQNQQSVQSMHKPSCNKSPKREIETKNLRFVVPDETKSFSKSRLKELSRPKEGFKKDVRYSKIFIKREVERLTKCDNVSKFSAAEKENRRRIESRIHMFLALLNMQDNPSSPVQMVHIPIRDDIMHVDISHHTAPCYESDTVNIQKILSNKRKVYYS